VGPKRGRTRTVKRKLPKQVLKELDAVVIDALTKISVNGLLPTEAQKKAALKVVQLDPGYIAIKKVVQQGSDEDLQKAKQIIREQFPAALRKPLLEAVRALPHPKGGRPRLLSDEDKTRACDQVAILIRESGLELRDALRQVASRFGVRLRTMQRVWQHRADYSKKKER
jgi:hypothetical protein